MPTLGFDEVEYGSGEFGEELYNGALPMPSAADVRAYLAGAGASNSWTDDEVADALLTERAAQARVCRVPADDGAWPADLAEALIRRVARNLSTRTLVLGYQTTVGADGTSFNTRVGWDNEIRRLEAPLRRLSVG